MCLSSCEYVLNAYLIIHRLGIAEKMNYVRDVLRAVAPVANAMIIWTGRELDETTHEHTHARASVVCPGQHWVMVRDEPIQR